MRIFFVIVMLFFFVTAKSQTVLSPGLGVYPHNQLFLNNQHLRDTVSAPKWFFSSYSGLSTSVSFFKGGNASVISAPLGFQFNHRLNDNWFAFANVAVAPSYFSLNSSWLDGFNKNLSGTGFRQNSFGLYPAASLGLMYVNDARTFSISGSVSAEQGMYPVMPYPVNNGRQQPVLLPQKQR